MNPARSADENREIARRAYALWEKEGRPHGRDQDHWARAEREFGSETGPASNGHSATQSTPDPGAPATPGKKPAARRKPAAEAAPLAAAPEPAKKPAARRKATTGA